MKDLRETEMQWLRHREAWVQFGAVRWPDQCRPVARLADCGTYNDAPRTVTARDCFQ
jgi:hypothetical protein